MSFDIVSAADAKTFTDCEFCPEMVVVPAGAVILGSYEDEAFRRKGERPKQKVIIRKDFALAKTETTLGLYRRFIKETQHQAVLMQQDSRIFEGCNYFDGKAYGYVRKHNWKDPGYPQREDEPVVCVSWSDATAFAEWLSRKTGRNYRVPSTVEFEYAMRSGSDAPWHWGTNPEQACEYANVADETFSFTYPKRPQFTCDDGYLYTARVGEFKANDFGLHDMLGNVWEWTNDCWHDDLSDSPLDGTSWESTGNGDCTARVPKGGSWISGVAWARAPARSKDGQHYRSFLLGFRLAADL